MKRKLEESTPKAVGAASARRLGQPSPPVLAGGAWTPGPWDNVRDDFIEAQNGTVVVEQINNDVCEIPEEQITANAHLIAAAPDLYDALLAALPYVRYSTHEYMSDLDGNESDKRSVVTQAISALAKARRQHIGENVSSDTPAFSTPESESAAPVIDSQKAKRGE